MPWPSAIEEGEPVLADLQLVPVLELCGLDALAIHERPVEAALVFDEEGAVTIDEHRMLARHRHVVEEDAAVGRAPDRCLLLRVEHLARSASSGANDERGSLDAEILERLGGCIVPVFGREGLRRLGAAFVLHQQRSAPRAVVRGLGILEAALLAINVTHKRGMLSRDSCSERLLATSARVARTRSVWDTLRGRGGLRGQDRRRPPLPRSVTHTLRVRATRADVANN